ncbi:Endonuclease/exonuclease/phosphatase [Desarmillaria tabescens]|uniref:DNA-(apurinic or apyrimidinic site) endonuclease n=1 Tax=Armillaria tabescens TaxID=1929756 RepID=A0AA39NEA3_ARMTA|nr:Endonuclease/exonuclease/phosphatase [Desarmillaria tabescens]KAK0463924.1 Endonuclease/exonuclease/phosphatase [Desarmillaria tabescens]
MRILTWNINGIRTIPQYHPWNTLKTQEAILDHLDADIICFQEMKTSRQNLSKDIATPEPYTAFFSFPAKKTGYSGVAIYTRIVPCKAEEGLTGLLDIKPPLTHEERISPPASYPCHSPVEAEGDNELDLKDLDSEGRTLVLDFGMFVLINVYCPNDGTDAEDRIKYKMDFHRLLSERSEQREVIVVGDLNACASLIDHCEGEIMLKKLKIKGGGDMAVAEEAFWAEKEGRNWLREWLAEGGGPMVDVVRRQWPDRKGMFTCWNTKISARASNYGTRIDYILVTPGLLPWVKTADIQPHVKGSDHCPVMLDLYDELPDSEGPRLLQHMLTTNAVQVPRLSSKYWDEFSGKQRSLDTFFGQKAPTRKTAGSTQPSSPLSLSPSPPPSSQLSSQASSSKSIGSQPIPVKRKQTQSQVSSSSKKAKPDPEGQTKLSSFFSKPKEPTKPIVVQDSDDDNIDDEDYRLAVRLSLSADTKTASPSSSKSHNAWKALLAPIQPPRCLVHNEPTKELTVTKPGANKGKNFFICSRPVGPGYDKGKAERDREDVDPRYKCNFFKWSSEVKREALRKEV